LQPAKRNRRERREGQERRAGEEGSGEVMRVASETSLSAVWWVINMSGQATAV
jgi:hypothetical protein